MGISYADLEIRILNKEANGYPVELTLNSEQQFDRGYLDPVFLPWIPSAEPEADGERIFSWLFGQEHLRTAWAEIRGRYPQRRIRLRIDTSAPELHTIPWELLRDKTDGSVTYDLAAATATPFTRYIAGKWQPGNPIFKRPIRILVVIANPTDLGSKYQLAPIEVEQEWNAFQSAMKGLAVELVQLPAPCTFSALETELRKGYHVLHFIGHGEYGAKISEAVLYMENAEHGVALVKDSELAEALARQLANAETQNDNKLRLVFLASCQTATRSPSDAFRGLAPKLVDAGVPAVVAMQDLVAVPTARTFTQTFYKQFLQHGQVDLAANEARAAVLTAKLPGAAVPVLFMRLRDGLLLGTRGHITSERSVTFWPFLLENISCGQCTPFLGPRIQTGLLADRTTLAEELAKKYEYPMADHNNLVRVAQFIALSDPDLLRKDYLQLLKRSLFDYLGIQPTQEQKRYFRNLSLSVTTRELKWDEKVLERQENEIHHLLADLKLPLYVTTNADSFLFEVLKAHRTNPRRIGPRWVQPNAGTPQYVITPDPSPENPVILHLNGNDDPEQQEHLVLSEDDYMMHLVRLARDQELLLPSNLLPMLSANSFLLLGYQLDDWEFRTLLHSLIKPIASTNRDRKMHIGVQLEPDQSPGEEKAREYLARYLGRFNISIYWGTPQQFVSELHTRWQELAQNNDGW